MHRSLGPGFLESIYEEALCVELDRRSVVYQRQLPVRVRYEGVPVGLYKLDLVVCGKVVVEIKAVEAIESAHLAVTLAYLKATSLQVGLVINFSDCVMRSRRVFRDPSGRVCRAGEGEKEEKNIGRKERQDFLAAKPPPDEQDALSLSQTVGHKDVAHGEGSLQDPQLV